MSKEWLIRLAMRLDRRNLWRLGRLLYVQARGDVPNNLYSNGETRVQQELLHALSKNQTKGVVFDVGANIGNWTMSLLNALALQTPEASLAVHAFEPVPTTFQILQTRLGQHPLGKFISLVPEAVSDEVGVVDMFIVGEQAGTNSLHPDPLAKASTRIAVKTTTAVAYCLAQHIETIHFLKCDAEGHDMAVLLGAKALFEAQKIRACQFEYGIRWVYARHYLKDVFDFIQGMPYRLGKITPQRVELYDRWHPELERFFDSNYLLIHEQSLSWFTIADGKLDASDTYQTLKTA